MQKTPIRAVDRYFSSTNVARLFHVTPGAVITWISAGRLAAFRTPGNHRRVAAAELVRFCEEFRMPIPAGLRTPVGSVLLASRERRLLTELARVGQGRAAELQFAVANTATDALLSMGASQPDVFVLDLDLPGPPDGLEILERLKINAVARNTARLVLSGHADDATVKGCEALGAAACFQKPVDVSALVQTIVDLRRAGDALRR